MLDFLKESLIPYNLLVSYLHACNIGNELMAQILGWSQEEFGKEIGWRSSNPFYPEYNN